MRRNKGLRAGKVAVLAAIAITVFGFVVERLWNWLMPGIFGWRTITFVQALGLLVLSKILFGGVHRHGGWRRGGQQGRERWAGLSAEQRERFKSGLRGRHGCWPDRANERVAEETRP